MWGCDRPPAPSAESDHRQAQAAPPSAVVAPAPYLRPGGREPGPLDFTLPDLSGKPVTLSKWRGHPVIVDFWATWCVPCRKEIPRLNEIYRRERPRGLIVVGVSVDTVQGEGSKVVAPFVKEFGIAYPVLLADQGVIDKLAVIAIPTTLLVGLQGRVVSRIQGAGPPSELAMAVEKLLEHSSRTVTTTSDRGAPRPH